MGRHTLLGNPPIEVQLRRSARARRLSLRVSRLDGQVSLTLPHAIRDSEGITFLQSKEAWLRKQLDTISPSRSVGQGRRVLIKGQEITIATHAARNVRLMDGTLFVAQDRPVAAQVKGYLRQIARTTLAEASDRYATQIGRRYTKLTLRDTRSRWGSCTADGGLMYSWRLIMAPPEVLDYVAAHEVAHLVQMNHSPAFWQVVGDLCPAFETHRQWLRAHGDLLHRYTFDD